MLDDQDVSDEKAWRVFREQWRLRPDTTYLNHGSFGPPPRCVQRVRRWWQDCLDEQPMDFFVRRHEGAWYTARAELADFLGAAPESLTFVSNATHAMNVVAASFPLQAGDEVVLNNHEYGAVQRIWERACDEAGAAPPRIAQLPRRLETPEDVVEAVFREVTPRTRLIVISHITSPTALVLPVEQIVAEAHERGIAVCVDGPHAIAQQPLSLEHLAADFYTASLHKWLSAPFGSGFLYAAPRWHARMRTPLLSWGRLPENRDERTPWTDEFLWAGTNDPAAFLSLPMALRFLQRVVGIEPFRQRSRYLAEYAAERIAALAPRPPFAPRRGRTGYEWYTAMAHVPLPDGDNRALQQTLWRRFGIEVPIVAFEGERTIRVSCHLYNGTDQIDQLLDALKTALAEES